jgi:hypothetical protein
MLFDKLCGLAERHLPQLIPSLEQAALFHFPGIPHNFLQEVKYEINYNEANELFHLPFPVVAIEDDASITILMDSQKDQIGLHSERYFLDMFCIDDSFGGNTNERMRSLEEVKDIRKEIYENFGVSYTISAGSIYSLHYQGGSGQLACDGVVNSIHLLNKKKIIHSHKIKSQNDMDESIKEILRNPITAYEELIMLSNPKYFILEDSPAKEPKQKKGSRKIPRSHQRPLFTYLKPADIRQKLALEHPGQDQTRNSPVPHERRKHLRRLRKESGYKEDKVVPVKACWIGASEKEVKGRRYRVRLDL